MSVLEPFAWSPVLVVDDDQASALLALKLLLRAGLRSVETVTDARLATDWVVEHSPDLVLLDLHMPYLDGFSVLAELRRRYSSTELPVIVLTADDSHEASERALGLGANDFLGKPLNSTELTHRVRNLLDMRAAHRSLHRRQRWIEGAERFSRELFSGEVAASLPMLAERARGLAEADHVATLEAPPGGVSHELGGSTYHCVDALQSGSVPGLSVELGPALCARLAGDDTPLLVEDAKAYHDLTITGPVQVDVGPMMLLPVKGPDATRGVVALLRERGREPYAASDLDAAHQFAMRAAIALELVDRRAERKRYLDLLDILVQQVAEYAIIRLDEGGHVESWNAGAARLEGYASDEAIGRHFSLFHPDEDLRRDVPQHLLDQARTAGRAHHQGWSRRKDGTRFWAETSLTALHDERGALVGYAMVTRDMTESRRLELARESFFTSVSHDLRTPLSSIQGFIEMIPLVDGARRDEFIDRVQSNVDRLTMLIDNLLDHARLRAGAVAMDLEVVDPATVVGACVRDLAPVLGTHEVVVDRAPFAVLADAQALGRVLGNLLVNAAKYSPEGTPIEVGFDHDDERGRILVTDHGRGIAAQDLDTIFDEFERGALAQADGGTGLGLASVRQLVSLQNGQVRIDSEPGVGTTVTVELPLP